MPCALPPFASLSSGHATGASAARVTTTTGTSQLRGHPTGREGAGVVTVPPFADPALGRWELLRSPSVFLSFPWAS